MSERDRLAEDWAKKHDEGQYDPLAVFRYRLTHSSFLAGWSARDAELAAKDARIKELVEKAEEAFHNLLSNASLDWYVQQFRRTEAPSGNESGAVATIHNRETERRAIAAFELARKALAAIRDGRKSK